MTYTFTEWPDNPVDGGYIACHAGDFSSLDGYSINGGPWVSLRAGWTSEDVEDAYLDCLAEEDY